MTAPANSHWTPAWATLPSHVLIKKKKKKIREVKEILCIGSYNLGASSKSRRDGRTEESNANKLPGLKESKTKFKVQAEKGW